MAKIDVFVDTETTGFGHVADPPRDDAIVEFGMAYNDLSKKAPIFREERMSEMRCQL
jgi:hypothetical protein